MKRKKRMSISRGHGGLPRYNPNWGHGGLPRYDPRLGHGGLLRLGSPYDAYPYNRDLVLGHGIFSSLFSKIVPFVTKTVAPKIVPTLVKHVAPELVKGGIELARDLSQGKSLKGSLKRRGIKATATLARKTLDSQPAVKRKLEQFLGDTVAAETPTKKRRTTTRRKKKKRSSYVF
jgi:hypothetical protein